MSDVIERMARAIRHAATKADIEAAGYAVPTNPEWWADIPVDDEDRAAARAALEAAKYVDGADEARLIKVSNAERVEAVSLSLAWDGLIDEALNPTPDPPVQSRIQRGLSEALAGLFREMGVKVIDVTPAPGEKLTRGTR